MIGEVEMPKDGSLKEGRDFRPQSHAMALEPRIMFDGAAASAVEHHHAAASPSDAMMFPHHIALTPRASEGRTASVARELLGASLRLLGQESRPTAGRVPNGSALDNLDL